ncbi:ribosome maturation factor RimM [Acidicapsa acidisoli]|uniref:ribosome maturation factor RimM n=1 Tax=Acidicapsa acidisoli TaxID=1615681 RepID=UPI0021DF550D|nr:ribosome maturation factor RimM [Acidicapsa acidisoli]
MADQVSGQAWVWLARIRKAQGRKGEVLAEILTDFPEKFAERKRVWLLSGTGLSGTGSAGESAREMVLDSYWMNKGQAGGIVLHFTGVDSITEAEMLRGMVVAIPRAERMPLGEDEVYVGDLIGCSLFDVAADSARCIGVIEDVDRDAGPVALLVVKSAGGAEILVPFAKAYLRRIDPDGKRVEMALPEGLVEVQVSTGS